MRKIALLCLFALLLVCMAPSSLAFSLSADPNAPIVFELVGFETFGSLDLLSDLLADSPGSVMSLQIVLSSDGTYQYDYRYNEQTATASGTWSTTMNSYILEAEDGSELTLLRDAHGYYVLALDGYNILLLTEDAIKNGVYSIDDQPGIVPDNIADFDLPFKGNTQSHREAVDLIGGMLENVSIRWLNDVELTSGLSCAQFVISSGEQIRIVYNTSTGKVFAYVFGVELSDLDTLEAAISKLQGSSQISIPVMSAMWVDSTGDEAAFMNTLNGYDWNAQAIAFAGLLRDAFDTGSATIDYFGYKLTMIRSSDGYSHPLWVILHSPTDKSDSGFSSTFGSLPVG